MPEVAKQVMLMNRIGPSHSELHLANADGTGERKLLDKSGFDYHANFSYDGQWIVFTSERSGYGKADLYRVHPDGTGLEQLTDGPALDDQGALSPDNSLLAWVSSRGQTHLANIWTMDLNRKQVRDLTRVAEIQGDPTKPNGFYRPQWSPDGKWIAFTSDRNTDWKTHDNNTGWEDLQELSIYLVRPDGSGFRRITEAGLVSGSPKWSADGKEIIYYEMPVEGSWKARVAQLSKLQASQIVSINVETGNRTEFTSGPGLKLSPQFLPDGRVGYVTKVAQVSGIAYIDGSATFPPTMRSPSWSPDGKQVVYTLIDNRPRPQNQQLYSWDADYEFRYTDVFPSFSINGELLVTSKDTDSSIAVMNKDGSNKRILFKSTTGCTDNTDGPCGAMDGVAFGPNWSKDGEWIVFCFGGYLRMRKTSIAKIMLMRRDGTDLLDLTDGTPNAGFPSFSPNGKEVVYRSYGPDQDGLRILNIETKQVRVLTDRPDNLPDWSVNNSIVFTRRSPGNRFDVCTIDPDGANLKQLTDFPASDGHAVWSYDGKHIMWNSGIYGFKDEAALYDNTFQPYGQNWIMNADGSNKRQLTDSPWEDSMPCIVPPYAM